MQRHGSGIGHGMSGNGGKFCVAVAKSLREWWKKQQKV